MTLTRDQAEEWARHVADALESVVVAWTMHLGDAPAYKAEQMRAECIRIARKEFVSAIADVMLSAGNQ